MIAVVATLAQVASAAPPQTPYGRVQVVMPVNEQMRQIHLEWGFAESVIDGDRVYLSGVVAGLRKGETDPTAAFERAFGQIEDILRRSGSSWDGVVEMTSFHTDLPAQMPAFVKVKHRYVRAPFPAWTAIDIDRLAPDSGLVEIKLVARRR